MEGASEETPKGTFSTSEETNTSIQASEVSTVKAAFPNRCRVMLNVGGYSSSVTVQPEDLDVTIKFQLQAAYPSSVPEITIRSESLEKDDIAALRTTLTNKAQSLLGGPMIQKLIREAESQLKILGLKKGKASIVNSHTYLGRKPAKPKKHKKKQKSEDEEIEDKLPSMKTADDVIKRIIWDDALEKDDFIVGYIDRFRGLVEKYFSAFSWEDLASVDYDVLAVPKHRIQYFKFKDVKVWDKVKRMDNVFGSANGTKTIDIAIKEWREMQALRQEGNNTESGNASGSNVRRENSDSNENSFTDTDSDDDDDDGIVVNIAAGTGIGASAKAEMKPEQNSRYWEDKLRPNYFLCVRITNPKIMDRIGNIQDYLMQAEPLFGECCIPGVSLHMTLCTLGLDTGDQLQNCMDTLKKIKSDLVAALPTSLLDLKGVSNFYNRVVYAKVNYKKDFLTFCHLLKLYLREAGVQIRDGYEFVPHVTIMKTTRPVSRLRGSKNIDPRVYEKFVNESFGEQSITGIHLCSMGNERREDGFYVTPLELDLSEQ